MSTSPTFKERILSLDVAMLLLPVLPVLVLTLLAGQGVSFPAWVSAVVLGLLLLEMVLAPVIHFRGRLALPDEPFRKTRAMAPWMLPLWMVLAANAAGFDAVEWTFSPSVLCLVAGIGLVVRDEVRKHQTSS